MWRVLSMINSDSMKLLNYFEKHLDELLKILEGAVNLESPSHENKIASDKCSKYLQELFRSIGFKIQIIPQESNGDHFIAELGEGKKGVLCVGHYDTVFPIGTIKNMPFKIEKDKAYGPGILDMKGGIIMGYYAVKALQELDMLPEDKITFFINGDEESGSFNSSELIVKEARKNRYALILEPGQDEIGQVKIGRYGRCTYDITAYGKAAHSGSNPHHAISPLLELAHQLIRIHEMNDYEGGVTLTPTYIQAGIHGTCVVPEAGKVSVDVRARDGELLKKIHDVVMNLSPATSGIKLEIKGGIDKPPLEGDKKLFETARELGAEIEIEVSGVISRGGSDGNFTAAAGVPTLDGLGMTGLELHTSGEYININYIPKRTTMLARMIQTL
jgi:glutamate carboxypeptidase